MPPPAGRIPARPRGAAYKAASTFERTLAIRLAGVLLHGEAAPQGGAALLPAFGAGHSQAAPAPFPCATSAGNGKCPQARRCLPNSKWQDLPFWLFLKIENSDGSVPTFCHCRIIEACGDPAVTTGSLT